MQLMKIKRMSNFTEQQARGEVQSILQNPVQKDFTLMSGIEGELIGMMSSSKPPKQLSILDAHDYIVN